MNSQTIDHATKTIIFRTRIDAHRTWIEAQLGIPLSDAVILDTAFPFAQVAIAKLLNHPNSQHPEEERTRTLAALIEAISIPPTCAPIVDVDLTSSVGVLDLTSNDKAENRYALNWEDCPVSLQMRGILGTIIAMNVYYHNDPTVCGAQAAHLLIVRRTNMAQVLGVLYESKSNRGPTLNTPRANPRMIASCT